MVYLICFVKVLYAKLSRSQIFSSASAVNAAFSPGDTTGKDLTKEVIKRAVRVAKGELRHDLTHQELRRACACSAYNALISVLVNVQDDIKFYNNFIFTENASKGEALWSSLIDINKVYDFDVEVNFKASSKSRFVAVRKSVSGEDDTLGSLDGLESTVSLFGTSYLSDSSLGEDLSQYDFSAAVVLAVGEKRNIAAKR